MTLKAVMVDVDGVVVVHPDPEGWGVNLERDLGLSAKLLDEAFFQPHWHDIVHGHAELRGRLSAVLAEIAPHLSCSTLIDYWFQEDAHLNGGLLDDLAAVRASGLKIHLATVQEHERARYLWDQLGLRERFDDMHYSAELGCAKPAAEFYAAVEIRTRLEPREIFFIDDRQPNVDAALARGWRAALWTSGRSLRSLLREEFD